VTAHHHQLRFEKNGNEDFDSSSTTRRCSFIEQEEERPFDNATASCFFTSFLDSPILSKATPLLGA